MSKLTEVEGSRRKVHENGLQVLDSTTHDRVSQGKTFDIQPRIEPSYQTRVWNNYITSLSKFLIATLSSSRHPLLLTADFVLSGLFFTGSINYDVILLRNQPKSGNIDVEYQKGSCLVSAPISNWFKCDSRSRVCMIHRRRTHPFLFYRGCKYNFLVHSCL